MSVLVDGEIVLYGTVGDLYWGQHFTALEVVQALAEVGRSNDVVVRLNSPGGIIDEGTAIFNALKAHSGEVTVYVDSMAASAGSVIAMAGDTIIMRNGSLMMIHDPAGVTIGDSAAHQKSIEALETYASAVSEIYAEQTGMTPEEARADMREEIWLTAEEAVERGYADQVDEASDEEFQATAFNYRLFQNAPSQFLAMADENGWTKVPRKKARKTAANRNSQQEIPMANESADKKPAVTDAELQQVQARHQTELADARKQATEETAAAERVRLSAILDSDEAKGREQQARHLAFKTSMSADEAKAILAAAPVVEAAKEPAKNRFEAAMDSTKNPVIGADGGAIDEDDPAAVAASITAAYKGGQNHQKRSA